MIMKVRTKHAADKKEPTERSQTCDMDNLPTQRISNTFSLFALPFSNTIRKVETEIGHLVMGGAAQRQEQTSTWAVLQEMIDQPKIRTLLLSALFLQMAQQFSGINAVFYYSTTFFDGVIENPLVGTTIVNFVNVLATYAVLFLMDRYGRKTLILWSSGGMFWSCIAIVLSLLGYLNNILALVAVMVYVCFFEFGLGPIPWLIVAEMFNGKGSKRIGSQILVHVGEYKTNDKIARPIQLR